MRTKDKGIAIKLNEEESVKLIKAGMIHKGMMQVEDIEACQISVYRATGHEMGIKIELEMK